jgi:hypothetical protein
MSGAETGHARSPGRHPMAPESGEPSPQAAGALERLLSAERALTERLAELDREVAELQATAANALHERERRFEEELTAELAALSQRSRESTAREVAAIRDHADAAIARVGALDDAAIARLADRLVLHLLSSGSGGTA